MALTRSAGARRDANRGTAPIEVRKASAAQWATTGVVAGGASPLVVGTAGFAYSVGAAQFVASRGASDGVNVYTNDGALSIACPTAPGSGLSRIDIIWTRHPTAGENGDTTSEPILGVASGTAASSNPSVPSIPTGALELARNLMTSAATTTLTVPGNTIAQTATTAYLRGTSRPCVQATKSAAQFTAASAGNSATIAFDTENFDTDNMHSTTSNNTRLTSVQDGYYRVVGKAAVAITNLGYTSVTLVKNGSVLPQTVATGGPATGAYARIDTSALVPLLAGDYVELWVSCSVGSSAISVADCVLEAEYVRQMP